MEEGTVSVDGTTHFFHARLCSRDPSLDNTEPLMPESQQTGLWSHYRLVIRTKRMS